MKHLTALCILYSLLLLFLPTLLLAQTATEIAAEINNDPQGLGYKDGATWKADHVIADLINDPTNGATINRSRVTVGELREAIALTDYTSLTTAERQYLDLILSDEFAIIDTEQGEIRSNLLAIFTGGTTTRTNMIFVVNRQGSRAEVLWGEGVGISPGDVGRAANQ